MNFTKNILATILIPICVLFFVGCGEKLTTTDASVPSDGHNALVLVSPEAAGTNCTFGGQKIETGLDANDNGTLEQKEVTNTSYVCNGSNGSSGTTIYNALATSTPESVNCNGLDGYKVETTIDLNKNGSIDNNPNNLNIFYVCADTLHTPFVDITAEPQGSNCPFGGQKIRFGLKIIVSGVEITNTTYACSIII